MKLEFVLACLLKLAPQVSEEKRIEIAEPIAYVSSNKWDAVMLVTTAYYETGGTLDCSKKGKAGERSCFQIFARFPDEYELLKDNYYAAATSLEMLHESWRMCSKLPESNRFSAYITGSCRSNQDSRNRYWTVKKLMSEIKIEY